MLTGEVKKKLIDVITPLVMQHQQNRARVDDSIVAKFMTIRSLPASLGYEKFRNLPPRK